MEDVNGKKMFCYVVQLMDKVATPSHFQHDDTQYALDKAPWTKQGIIDALFKLLRQLEDAKACHGDL